MIFVQRMSYVAFSVHDGKMKYRQLDLVSLAAVFRDVTQRSPGEALRDIPKDGCEGA